MRVVLDTNVLFAALVSDGLCRELFRRLAGIRGLVLSEEIIQELQAVAVRKLPKDVRVSRFLVELRRFCVLVEPATLKAPASRDAKDDVVIGTAVAARASRLVTGDKDLLVLERYGRIRIVSPRDCVPWLDKSGVPRR